MDNNSFYKKTKNDGFYLGLWEEISMPYDSSDYYMVIPTKYHLKPGSLAYELYGDSKLLWVFSVYNRDTINDILFDFTEGKIIRVPTKERLNKLL